MGAIGSLLLKISSDLDNLTRNAHVLVNKDVNSFVNGKLGSHFGPAIKLYSELFKTIGVRSRTELENEIKKNLILLIPGLVLQLPFPPFLVPWIIPFFTVFSFVTLPDYHDVTTSNISRKTWRCWSPLVAEWWSSHLGVRQGLTSG